MRSWTVLAGVLGLALASRAEAIPFRLRADALAQAQSPAGVLALDGESELVRGLEVETLLWMAGESGQVEGDALVAAVAYRDPEGRGVIRAGRFIEASGALPIVHLDGVSVLGRAPWRGTLELFGGMPVVPRFGPRAFDWVAGGRIGQSFGPVSAGFAYYQRRDAGQLADHELGLDAQLSPVRGFDLSLRSGLDLIQLGISELSVAMAYQLGAIRGELSASQRSPARLLPATSLFSVLGDAALRRVTAGLRWRVAPRLELAATGGARVFDEEPHEDAALSAELWLDQRGAGKVSLELRREGAPEGGWTGARGALRLPIAEVWALSAEAELAVPDHATRGGVWPWGLVAASWFPAEAWELAIAVEASVSPEALSSVDGLLRVGYQWGAP